MASLAVAVVVGGGLSLAACSSDDTGGTSGGTSPEAAPGNEGGATEAGGKDSSSPGVDAGGGEDAAPVEVNSCKSFVDRSADSASRTITWDFPVATAPERCMTVKKGQEVTFMGDFSTHPLISSGGDTPNPVAAVDIVGATGKVTLAKAGLFGWVCGNHPAMTGAIKVIE